MDVLAANQLARAFCCGVYATAGNRANLARFNFLDPASRRFHPGWDQAADTAVAILRTAAGHNPYDKDLHDLVGELSTRSDVFRTRWGAHDVRRQAPAPSASTTTPSATSPSPARAWKRPPSPASP